MHMDMIALIFLRKWSNGGLGGRYSGHNNHQKPPKKCSNIKGFRTLVVVVVLISTFKASSYKVYIRKEEIRFDKNCDYRVGKITTLTTGSSKSLIIGDL